jgi:hypothetical protein
MTAIMKVVGTVVSAGVRTGMSRDGTHMVPILLIELEDVGPGRHAVHARHYYTEQFRRDAEGWAAQLKKGTRLTIAAPIHELRLTVPHADFSIATPEDEEELLS